MNSPNPNSLETATAVLSVSEMYEADHLALDFVAGSFTLMQNAADGIVNVVQQHWNPAADVIVYCGPGNNGGDGFLVAAALKKLGFGVDVVFCGGEEDLDRVAGDARMALECYQQSGQRSGQRGDQHNANDILRLNDVAEGGIPDFLNSLRSGHTNTLVIDAIFGAGLKRAPEGKLEQLINVTNRCREASRSGSAAQPALQVLSVDLPSGVQGDTAQTPGAAIVADRTVSFFRKKPAHLIQPGMQHCGQIDIVDIGIPASVINTIKPTLFENDQNLWLHSFPNPTTQSHKYTRGHTLIASGPRHQTGACRLSALAALRIGSGVVTIASPAEAMDINAAHCTEIMLKSVDDADALPELIAQNKVSAMVIGPGFGIGAKCREFVLASLDCCRVVVLDADALTSFTDFTDSTNKAGAAPSDLFDAIKNSTASVVMTPHEGEFTRLFGKTAGDSPGKVELTRRAAEESGATIVFKGPDTVIAAPDGPCVLSDHGTPWLATAGSGDVLAGTIAGLLAQSTDQSDAGRTLEAVAAAVWVHGEAARQFGPGLIAGDLPACYPGVLKGLQR